MTGDFPLQNDLQWQGQRSSRFQMESTENPPDHVSSIRSHPDSAPGTESNRVEVAARLRRLALQVGGTMCLDEPSCYFIGPREGPIKIGFATDFSDRWGRLRCGSPVWLEIYAVVPGSRLLEGEYHCRFKAARTHGEWFGAIPELLDEIERLQAEQRALTTPAIEASRQGDE